MIGVETVIFRNTGIVVEGFWSPEISPTPITRIRDEFATTFTAVTGSNPTSFSVEVGSDLSESSFSPSTPLDTVVLTRPVIGCLSSVTVPNGSETVHRP